ncbi:MAG TPA: Holliday junction branch migration DNA helicase RuvB [Candidatus Levybacteria bacterium]|nr:Holliday junction branch migration DNA helicase RuvB [Candidatus Levybacteria bacterium]
MDDINPLIRDQPEEPEEEVIINSLRAKSWDEFYGQENIKESLQIAITAAKQREEAIEHVLLYGPPGLGKTTLSHLIAREMKSNIRVTSGPAIERAGDLASILTNLEKGDVLFIDEIHRLNKVVEETLYPAMEDYCLDIVIGKGPSARTLRLDLPQFTIIGATTRVGLLSAPLRDRFGVIHRLQFYTPAELCIVIKRAAEKLQVPIDEESIREIAQRSRGTPRIALKILKRARDYAQVKGKGDMIHKLTHEALKMLEVDEMGLDGSDIRLLKTIIQMHNGGPVGIETLASSLSEDVGTLEDVIEPYLMQIGFLKRTPRGRIATAAAYKHVGLPYPTTDTVQKKLIE